ncbi:MAG: UDP-N-acetylmuramoyl-L-alanine--D-glutamate ligase [Deltaproteobacteria bacterium]|nr:UDP-N-acetylmuramoyl-L-alanine--D-glutamate ligase [Deltaproteobacteria bacterium]
MATMTALKDPNSGKTPEAERRVLVVGLGLSGYWTARHMAQTGAEVTVSESRPESELNPDQVSELKSAGVMLETGEHIKKTFLNADLIVVSPGVPLDILPLTAAYERHIPVLGEMELASRNIHEPIIAVTGSNGKSTVTYFLGEMLKNSGLNVFVGGNIGTPLMAYAAKGGGADYLVVEVSSFQLDTIETFHPNISLLLNISPDHLDRYRDYPAYIASKLRIFENQGAGDCLILNDEDPVLSGIPTPTGLHVLRYGPTPNEKRDAFIQEGAIVCGLEEASKRRFSLDHFALPGIHNRENLMAAILVGQALQIPDDIIQTSIDTFRGLPNRLEHVDAFHGVSFFNDSKATNVDAAMRAVGSFTGNVILIAGGRHKGSDYDLLVETGRDRIKTAVFLGEARALLARAFNGAIPFTFAEHMDEAVRKAFEMAQEGDTVLLAPACSSFDMFSDYAHRGRAFVRAVQRLKRTTLEQDDRKRVEAGAVNG